MGVVVGGEGAPAPWGWRAEGSEMLEEWSLRDQGTQKTQPIDQERKVHAPQPRPRPWAVSEDPVLCVSISLFLLQVGEASCPRPATPISLLSIFSSELQVFTVRSWQC